MKKIAFSAILAGACVFFSSLFAATVPADIAQAVSGARAMGQHRLVVYGFNIYDATLWGSEGFSAASYDKETFALELRYLRNVSGDAIAERSLKEMRGLAPISDAQAQAWLVDMKRIFPNVKKGDALIGLHRANGGARFFLNGKPIGEVREQEFARLFFGIWLSAKTSEPKMRNALMSASATPGGGKP